MKNREKFREDILSWAKNSKGNAEIINRGVIKWLTAAKVERYTDFVKENESKANE